MLVKRKLLLNTLIVIAMITSYVLWIRADTADLVVADFVDIATSLNLPIKNEKDQRLVVTIVKRWFKSHHNWLLIFDNADNLETVQGFLPHRGARTYSAHDSYTRSRNGGAGSRA